MMALNGTNTSDSAVAKVDDIMRSTKLVYLGNAMQTNFPRYTCGMTRSLIYVVVIMA